MGLNGINDFAKGSGPKHQKLFKRLAENIMEGLFPEVKVSALRKARFPY